VPPAGWKFARASDRTLAAGPAAIIAVTTYDRLNTSRPRETVLRDVAERLGVVLPDRKSLFPKKPHQRHTVGEVGLSLYQFDRIRRSQENGVMVIFTTDLPSDAAVLGVAFVADNDRDNADQAILRAIESLNPPVAPGPTAERAPKLTAPASRRSPPEPPNAGTDQQGYHLDLHTLH
jgi:hypothetical protein